MADQKKPPSDEEFFGIANNLIVEEASDFLEKRMAGLDAWVQAREAHGQRADLRSLIESMMRGQEMRGPVITSLAAAMWKLREMEQANAEQ
jgi:hypothetical protein